jgi:hypothetical protein
MTQTNMSSSGETYKDGVTKGTSSARCAQERAGRLIPTWIRRLGRITIVEPDNKWSCEYKLGSPEALL